MDFRYKSYKMRRGHFMSDKAKATSFDKAKKMLCGDPQDVPVVMSTKFPEAVMSPTRGRSCPPLLREGPPSQR